jgi:3',5'-cyclic AMP phosphodiesterase CpdA
VIARGRRGRWVGALALLALRGAAAAQPAPVSNEAVRAIAPPKKPLPTEAASAQVTRFSFLVYGDTRGRRDGKEAQYGHSLVVDSMLATVKKLEPTPFPVRFVVMTGDAVVSGRDPRQWNVSFVELVDRITQGAGLPYFLSPGNHDVGGVPDSAAAPEPGAGPPAPQDPDGDPGRVPKPPRDGAPAGNPPSPQRDRSGALRNYLAAVSALVPREGSLRRLAGYPTYGFGFGNTFFVALDSNIAGDDRQLEWVRGQLEGLDRARYRHLVAFFHHPVYSSGPHGVRAEPPTLALRQRYMPLFRKHHVTLILNGHEHLYEHWVERYEQGGRHYRLDEIVTGGGGAPLYAFQGKPDLRDYLAAGRPEKVAVQQLVRPGPDPGDTPHHYVVVQVDGDRLRVQVVGVDWGGGFAPYRSRGTPLWDDPAANLIPETPR